jgi:hypothetical protein
VTAPRRYRRRSRRRTACLRGKRLRWDRDDYLAAILGDRECYRLRWHHSRRDGNGERRDGGSLGDRWQTQSRDNR